MTVLIVDVGNTRIKWARLDGERLARGRAAMHSRWRAADYARLFGARTPERVVAASVAGARVNRALVAAARRAGAAVRFLSTPRRGGGVTVGYAQPWRLGVDRFAAAVGAHALFPSVPVCVVGVGTALTVDLVGAEGRHRGGLIVPAPQLMVATLLAQTHGIRRRARGGATGGKGLFARSTRDAIERGAHYAAAALIDRAVEEASVRVARQPLVVLTGGGAPALAALLRSSAVGVPDLVLRGLAVLARAPASRQASRAR
ncbi:MAG TPA: type III pantothenate kinase [Steroidobacteraceae bacterium]|nr:type III pantothenate kinase [Steroidobacteraceae bacterium]